jgi:RNA polymerase sigma-70 factor (ECF subfamily)
VEDSPISDEQLMVLYQGGDLRAFEELYRRYSKKIYGYLKRRLVPLEVASEAFQIVFMKLHQNKQLYRPDLKFAPWIFTLSRNVCIDMARSNVRRNSSVELDENQIPSPVLVEAALSEELFEKLTEPQKKLLLLRYEEDRSFEEIAKVFDTSSSNARKMLSRIIQKLRGNA